MLPYIHLKLQPSMHVFQHFTRDRSGLSIPSWEGACRRGWKGEGLSPKSPPNMHFGDFSCIHKYKRTCVPLVNKLHRKWAFWFTYVFGHDYKFAASFINMSIRKSNSLLLKWISFVVYSTPGNSLYESCAYVRTQVCHNYSTLFMLQRRRYTYVYSQYGCIPISR